MAILEVINLGTVKAVFEGLNPPVNTRVLWYDENTGQNIHKYYNTSINTWVPLGVITSDPGGVLIHTDISDWHTAVQNEITSVKGVVNGVVPLNSSSKIDPTYLPSLSIGERFTSNSDAAMIALTAQIGDVCLRTDLSPQVIYLLTGISTNLSDWIPLYGQDILSTDDVPEGSLNKYFTTARVFSSILSTLTITNSAVTTSDSLITSIGKLQGQLNNKQATLVSGTNIKTINSTSLLGSSNILLQTPLIAGTDYLTPTGNGSSLTGLTTTQVSEGTNLYYTNTRVSLNSDVAANTAVRHNPLTLGTTNGLSLSTQILSLGLASSSTTGALTSTDWSTFNNSFRRLGDIYNLSTSFLLSSLYTQAGTDSTWTYGSTGITVSGGVGVVTNKIFYNSYRTNASQYERKITFTSVASGAGIGIGLHSTTAGAEVLGRIDTSTGTLYIDVYRVGTTTNKATSTSSLTISNGDIVTLSLVRNNGNYLLTAFNITTNIVLTLSFTDPYTYLAIGLAWSSANPSIYNYGGTQLITNDTYTVNNSIQKDIVFYGNSIGSGNYSGANENAAANIIARGAIGGVNLIAGGSNKTADGVLLIPEILALKPKVLIYTDGINDIIGGVSLATTQANVLAVINVCIANDIIPIICGVLPESSTAFQTAILAYNTWASTLGFVRYIDTYTTIVDSGTGVMNTLYDSGDGIHLNQYGQEVLATNIIAGIKSTVAIGGAFHFTSNGYKLNFSTPAFGGILVQNSSTSTSSSSGLRIIGNDNSTFAIVDINSNTATGAGGVVTAAGVTRFSTTGLNTYFGTQNNGASGAFIFSGGLGTVNVHAGFLNSQGYNWFDRINRFGDSATPVATIDILAGTTIQAPIKLNSGPLLTTPIAGTEEFLTDRRYFTQTTSTTRQTYAWLTDIPSLVGYAPLAGPSFTGAIGFSNPSGNTIMMFDAVTGSISSIRLRTGTTGSISDYSINAGSGSANNLSFVNNKTSATVMTLDTNSRVGIGVSPAFAKLEILSTTEQIRNAYDASNYLSITTGSTGITTLNPVGTAKGISFTLGSDATGDIFYRNSSGLFTRLGIGSTGNILTVASGLPSWSPPSGGTVTNISSANSDIGIVSTTTTPVLTFDRTHFPYSILTSPVSGDGLRYNGSTWINSQIIATGLLNWNQTTWTMSLNNKSHTISTPATGNTITLITGQINIINPAGTLAALTITLPSSPVNNDIVSLTFTQIVSTITYAGGTVIGAPTTAALGSQWYLTYDSGTTTWY